MLGFYVRLTLAEQELVFQTTSKKSMVAAVILNILWAGAGNAYVGNCAGGVFVFFTFVALLATAAWVGFGAAVLGLFLWSTFLAAKELERKSAELRSRISRGEFDAGVP